MDITQIGMAVLAIVISAVHGYAKFKETGKIGLDKTLDLAPDVLPEVRKQVTELGLDKAIEVGVNKIQEIRGTRLGKKLRRKARARIERLIGEVIE